MFGSRGPQTEATKGKGRRARGVVGETLVSSKLKVA